MRGRYLLFAMAGAVAVGAMSLVPVTKAFAVGAVSQYVMSPKPIAPAGTLAAATSVPVTITAEDSTNAAVPGATIYISFVSSSGGSASVGTVTLSKFPQGFTADTNGQVMVTYKTASTLPLSGDDRINAKNASLHATISNHDDYSYSGLRKFAMRPKPIAATNTLAANGTVQVTLRSINTSGGIAPNATVFLSFTQAPSGGSATVGTLTLTSTPQQFATDGSGALTIIYHGSATPPTTGTDTITAQNGATHSTIVSTDTYTY